MGGSYSHETAKDRSPSQVFSQLTDKLSQKFDSQELSTIRQTFTQLATPVDQTSIWTEDTFVKFLEVPDEVGSLLFLSASYVASFPYTDGSPMILTQDALLRVVAIMTRRTDGILSADARVHLLYNSFAVLDNVPTLDKTEHEDKEHATTTDSEMSNSAEIDTSSNNFRMRRSDLHKLLKFFLTIQEMSYVEVVTNYIDRFSGTDAKTIDEIATSIVQTVTNLDTVPLQDLAEFAKGSPDFLYSLSSLYSHFLFPSKSYKTRPKASRPICDTNLLNNGSSAQLSLFLPRDLVFGKIDALYRASHDGFSMGSFESKVLRYPGPTVLLLQGHSDVMGKVIMGIFNNLPWKQSSKETFGDNETRLFQLAPKHRVYKAQQLCHGSWFSKAVGIGIGCLPPSVLTKSPYYGTLSLVMDTSFEFATYRNEADATASARIEIRDVEVWGLGGDKEAQRKAWDWEEAEADRRRNINIHDMEADYGRLLPSSTEQH